MLPLLLPTTVGATSGAISRGEYHVKCRGSSASDLWAGEREQDLRQGIRCFLKPLEAWAVRWPAGSCTPCHCQENEDQLQVMGAWLRKTWEGESRNREVPRNAPGCHHGWVQLLLPQRSLGGWQNPPPSMPSLCLGQCQPPTPYNLLQRRESQPWWWLASPAHRVLGPL